MENKYTQQMHCENCGYSGEKEFETGTRSDGYFECPVCGCSDYKKKGYASKSIKDEIRL